MNDIEESKNECQDKVWCCKPTRVCDIKIEQIDLLYSEIERGNISHNADKFEFTSITDFSINESIPNSVDIERLHKFFGLFEINRESWIETDRLIISYQKEQGKNNDLQIRWGDILLIFEKKIYRMSILSEIDLSGLLYIQSNWNFFAIKLTKLDTWSSIIKKEKETSLFYQNWLEELIDHDSIDHRNMYAIVYKPKVTKFTSSKLAEIKTISAWENIKVIQIITNGSDEEKKELINTLKVVQKALILEIQWKTDSWLLMDECFWIEIFKRKKIRFISEGDWRVLIYSEGQELDVKDEFISDIEVDACQGNWKVIINCEDQELDQSDILKSIIEVDAYRCRIKTSIDQVSNIISITEFEFKNKYSN